MVFGKIVGEVRFNDVFLWDDGAKSKIIFGISNGCGLLYCLMFVKVMIR